MNPAEITEADIARSRADPRFKQVLLAKSLEQLLDTLHRLQRAGAQQGPASTRHMREGALMAVKLADLIRSLEERMTSAAQ